MVHRAVSRLLQSVPGQAFLEASARPEGCGLPPTARNSQVDEACLASLPTQSFPPFPHLLGHFTDSSFSRLKRGLGRRTGAGKAAGHSEPKGRMKGEKTRLLSWLKMARALLTTPLLGFSSCRMSGGPSCFCGQPHQSQGLVTGGWLFHPSLLCSDSLRGRGPFLGGELPAPWDPHLLCTVFCLSWRRASPVAARSPWSVVTSHQLGLSEDSDLFLRERKEEGRDTHKQGESEKEKEASEKHGGADRPRQMSAWEAGGLSVFGNSFSLDLYYFL